MTMRVPAFPGSVVVCAAALAATEEYAAANKQNEHLVAYP